MNSLIFKNWKASLRNNYLFIENTKTGWCDWPVVYEDGRVAYDHPYPIPKYAKKLVNKFINQNKEVI